MAEITNLTNKTAMAEEEAEQGGGGKKRPSLFLIIGIVLSLILAGGTTALFILQDSGIEEVKQQIEEAEQNAGALGAGSAIQTFTASESVFEENPLFTEVLEFTINLADGKRYLNMSVQIGLSNDQALGFINQRIPIVKDIIITTTQSLTTEDFRTTNGVETYKRTLLFKLNSGVFTTDFKAKLGDIYPIKRILFDRFVLQ